MIQYKKILMTLALLLTAVTGAWATGPNVINSEIDFESLKVGDILVEGFSMTGPNSVRFYFNAGRAKKGETLLNQDVSFYRMYISSVGTNAVITLSADAGDAAGTYTPIDENGQVANAWIVTSMNESGNSDFHLSGYKYVAPTDEPAEPAIDVKWDAATKTGTFEMPAFDVEIAPIYAPVAQWAKVDNVDQLPTAIEGIYAGTEDAIVKAGTVVEGQGTAMYFATTDAEMTAENAAKAEGWLSTLPTAAGYDGAQTVYVWYYIKGADTPQEQTATAENTFNDSEICTTPLTVTVLNNKFDIQFKAANANTIETGKATVTVGGTAATVTEGKLEGVKMGSEVKVKANNGYKFRKVEVKKKAASKLASEVTPEDIFKVIASDGMIYDNVAAAQSAGTVAQGLLVYVGSNTGNNTYTHGMALALQDEANNTWSGAKDACNAKNTSTPIVGALWIQASKDQWNTMFNAVGGDCKLRDCFSSAGGTNLVKGGYYWSGSSHEDYGEQGDYYCFTEDDWQGDWSSTSVYYNNEYYVRACIVF